MHREIRWWLAASAMFSAGWVLAFGAARWSRWPSCCSSRCWSSLALVLARLHPVPAAGGGWSGWSCAAPWRCTPGGSRWRIRWAPRPPACGWACPGPTGLAAVAAVVVLVAMTVAVWVVMAGTAVVAYAAGAGLGASPGTCWTAPALAVAAAAVLAVLMVVAATARRGHLGRATSAGPPGAKSSRDRQRGYPRGPWSPRPCSPPSSRCCRVSRSPCSTSVAS